MDLREHRVAIIWSGAIHNLDILKQPNIEIFQNIGAADVQGVINTLDFGAVSAVIGAPGIAAEIRSLIPVPLVIAYPNYIDILETVKDAELNRSLEHQKIALILHESNKIQEDRLDYFIHNTVDLYKYESHSSMHRVFQRIIGRDYALVIGGPTAVGMAKRYNIDAVQLIYREQALLDALEKTREILFLMDQELRQSQRLKAVIDVIPSGIIGTDESGTIELCNRHILHILGRSYDQVLGQNVCALLGDRSWEEVYGKNRAQTDTLLTYQKTKYFSTRQPILEGGRVIGSVGTLQEADKIQTMESKYRSHQNRGLVAGYTFHDIIGESAAMLSVIERARIYAQCDATILLEGETGTGKEIFAQSIHNESHRKKGPFVAINCAAITESLLESELMGYDEGAFTGAKRGGKAGLFERAHKGTIFLDEINQLPLQLQAKLLRVIQEKAVMHIGGDSVIPVDVRILVATNENLKQKIADQRFRGDLYYRVNVLNITLPPLRERRGDILPLMFSFARRFDSDQLSLLEDVDAMSGLAAGYDWPGNIRELQNFVERYMILKGRLGAASAAVFSDSFGAARTAETPETSDGEGTLRLPLGPLEEMEREIFKAALRRCNGNKTQAAALLGIGRNTLHQRLGKLTVDN